MSTQDAARHWVFDEQIRAAIFEPRDGAMAEPGPPMTLETLRRARDILLRAERPAPGQEDAIAAAAAAEPDPAPIHFDPPEPPRVKAKSFDEWLAKTSALLAENETRRAHRTTLDAEADYLVEQMARRARSTGSV